MSNELPAAFRGNEIYQDRTHGSLLLVRLIFQGDRADDPVLAKMIRTCKGVECTMLFGNLDEIHGVPFGRFIIGLSGEDEAINTALNFLGGEDVRVEVIGYVRRSPAAVE